MSRMINEMCPVSMVGFTLAVASMTLCGCGPAETVDPQAAFEEAYAELDKAFPQGADSSCEALGLWEELGTDVLHSGYVLGVEGDGVLGAAAGFGGMDIVFDVYHQQMTVSKYGGGGVALPSIGASVEIYSGIGMGFKHGVSDWDGYFITAEAELGLPFLKKFLHLAPAGFVSAAYDEQGALKALIPPEGVYGFTFGLSVGVGVELIPTPIGAEATLGLWGPHETAIAHYYKRFQKTRIFGIRKLKVRLVDHHTGELCPNDWPESGSDHDCIIEFGDPDASRTRRAVDTAYAMCSVSGACRAPLAFPMATAALGVGVYRDTGHDPAAECEPQH